MKRRMNQCATISLCICMFLMSCMQRTSNSVWATWLGDSGVVCPGIVSLFDSCHAASLHLSHGCVPQGSHWRRKARSAWSSTRSSSPVPTRGTSRQPRLGTNVCWQKAWCPTRSCVARRSLLDLAQASIILQCLELNGDVASCQNEG